jgi:hypothetical protein
MRYHFSTTSLAKLKSVIIPNVSGTINIRQMLEAHTCNPRKAEIRIEVFS